MKFRAKDGAEGFVACNRIADFTNRLQGWHMRWEDRPVRSFVGTCLATIPILRDSAPAEDFTWQAVAVGERIASACLLVALAPLLAAGAAALCLMSGRTPFIAHRRVGWRGTDLWMLKLRTMWDGERRSKGWIEYVDDEAGPGQKQAGDPRVSNWFARFCRRHSIDEIPQLWHVIRGEMSLVGPRPVTAAELRRYYGAATEEILQMRPGIAGLWQISGRNRLTYAERRRLDLELVRGRSLRLYGSILIRTIPEVWSGANTW
jgi:lipopolysaccharide/colanic/teichoic acid biosynthesis glycosyltransferase